MRIGLDLDNVISDFDKIIFEEMLKEDKNKRNSGIINPEAKYFTLGMFDWSNEEVCDFFANNMERMAKILPVRKNCKKVIDKLLEEGHEIYIVSNRVAPDYKEPEKTTIDWLRKNNINFTKLVISKGINKITEYNQLKLDIMFDDRDDACLQMRNDGVNCVLMLKKLNKNKAPKNMPYVKSWIDLYNYVNNKNNEEYYEK